MNIPTQKYLKAAVKAALIVLATIFIGSINITGANPPIPRHSQPSKSKEVKPNTFKSPDFAFPRTVADNARNMLDMALAEGNGKTSLLSLLQLTVADGLIDPSTSKSSVNLADSCSALLPAPYSSLCKLLEASIFNAIYNSNRWQFNSRTLPLDSFPDDPMAWNSTLFAKKTLELVTEACADSLSAIATPIADIKECITGADEAIAANLTVYDFIVLKSRLLLADFSQSYASDPVIPFRGQTSIQVSNPEEKCTAFSDMLLDSLISIHEREDNVAALTLAVCAKASSLSDNARKDFLNKWYGKTNHNEWSAYILSEICDASNIEKMLSDGTAKDLLVELEGWLDNFPKSRLRKTISAHKAELLSKSASISVPSTVVPDVPVSCSATLRNTSHAYAIIYRVDDSAVSNGSLDLKQFPGKSRKVASVAFGHDNEAPFAAQDIPLMLPPLEPGYYAIIPSETPSLAKDWRKRVEKWSINLTLVSAITFFTTYDGISDSPGKLYAVDSRTQQPLQGAEVKLFSTGRKRELQASGLTDSSGAFPLPAGSFSVEVRHHGSFASDFVYIYPDKDTDDEQFSANVLTDLSVYRPGDTLRFALTAWRHSDENSSLLKDSQLKVTMRDANWKEIDTLTLTTDKWGRADGSFTIPKDGILGSYSLTVAQTYKDKNHFRQLGSCRVEVAEYKRPTFFIDLQTSHKTSYVIGDTLTFTGKVSTFSGMPLADTKVDYKITWSPWWRIFRATANSASFGETLTTDSSGNFTIQLPTAGLRGTDFECGIYRLSVSATSSSGETQSAPVAIFSLGDDMIIDTPAEATIKVTGDSVQLSATVRDIIGHPVNQRLNFVATDSRDGKEILSGSFMAPTLSLPSDSLPSGRYEFRFMMPDSDVKSQSEVTVYRSDDKTPPFATPLWAPETQIIVSDDADDAEVTVGSGYVDSWVFCMISETDSVAETRWIHINDENLKIKVPAPKPGGKVSIHFIGTRNFDTQTHDISILPASSQRKLTVASKSFRDKISAGDKEKWEFLFTVDDVPSPEVAAMAVMTDKALNSISPFRWNFNFWKPFIQTVGSINRRYTSSGFSVYANFTTPPKYEMLPLVDPNWQTYGYGFLGRGDFYLLTAHKMGMRSSATTVLNECSMDMSEELESVSSMEGPAMAKGAVAKDDDSYEENAYTGNGVSSEPDTVAMRPADMPLAFFMPKLSADNEGVVEVEFDTPNFNTTWQFQIAGYTDDLLSAGLLLDATASKQVMVSVNQPRFLRTGDKASVSAMMFNNTNAEALIEGAIEIFNPMDGSVIHAEKFHAVNVSPGAKCTVATTFEVPSSIQALGIRALAHSGHFYDGEQTAIPVLPSSTPVTESSEFYLGRDNQTTTLVLPKLRKDAKVTLRYCTNPIWDCVLALPTVAQTESASILSLSRAFMANGIATDIINRFPAVTQELARISADSTLMPDSHLASDPNLKIFSLGNTPWVNDAESETMALKSLVDMLNPEVASERSASLLSQLKSRQNSDGGWGWCPGMESSEFITRCVLLNLSIMKQSASLSDLAAGMVAKAISYCDSMELQHFNNNGRKIDGIGMLPYLYVRSFFDAGNGPEGFKTLKLQAIEKIAHNWRELNVGMKSIAATLLLRTPGYRLEAETILASVAQFAVKSEEKGWSFPSSPAGFDDMTRVATAAKALEAFYEAGENREAVDGLRQGIILQKETFDWGSAPATSEAIWALLSCGADWTADNSLPEISVAGKRLEFGDPLFAGASLTMDLNPKEVSGKKMVVKKSTQGPAWGGVISQYVAPIKEVTQESCPNLSIRKEIYLVETDFEGEKLVKGTLHMGDRVRVTLTITSDKDVSYVAVNDGRSSCLEPVDQLSGFTFSDGIGMYREVRDSATNFFIGFLPKGVTVISYDCHVDRIGAYALGIAQAQSLYSPLQSAHSAGSILTIKE